MTSYTPYQQRIRKCFADAYKFLDNHKHVRTDEGWRQVARELAPYKDPLTVDLLEAVFNELDRECKTMSQIKKDIRHN